MADPIIEAASSGRAKCRGCGLHIAKGELRLGERLSNPFAETDPEGKPMTLWFHLRCGAYKRPEVLLAGLQAGSEPVEQAEALIVAAQLGVTYRRVPRINGAERAASGRARCRQCREPIAKGAMRIKLVFYEEGRFDPGGFIHAACARDYFETAELLDRLRHFSPELGPDELTELASALRIGNASVRAGAQARTPNEET